MIEVQCMLHDTINYRTRIVIYHQKLKSVAAYQISHEEEEYDNANRPQVSGLIVGVMLE